MKKVSVVMPVYNNESNLKSSIESVLHQTYANLELILINDGSTDGSSRIIDYYGTIDQRIKVVHQQNRGASYARNIGIDLVTGDYIMFIDSDDFFDLNMVEVMLKKITSRDYDLVICGIKKVVNANTHNKNNDLTFKNKDYNSREEILDNVSEIINSGLFSSCVNKIYKVDLIQKNKIYMKTDLDIGEDFLFNLSCLKFYKSLAIIDSLLYNYKIEESYLTHKYRENLFEIRKQNIEELRKFYEENHILNNEIEFLYIKLAYACIFQIFYSPDKLSLYNRLNKIKVILSKQEILVAINQFRATTFTEKLLKSFLKIRSKIIIYYLCKIINLIRKYNIVKLKKVSL